MNRFVRILITVVIGLLVYQRSKFTHSKVVYYPPANTLTHFNSDLENENFYQVGAFEHDAQLTILEKFSRKKINNYLFLVDNEHKIEIALIDLGYIKILNANYFAGSETYSFEEQLGFTLPENFKDYSSKINKTNPNFRLVFDNREIVAADGSRAVQTDFDILIKRKDGEYSLKLVHIQPENTCVTYVREGVVSYKCYGGVGSGEVALLADKKGNKIEKKIVLTHQNTVAAFDGFRASGWEWNWVWGMGSGLDSFRQPWSINFGSIRQIGEDFAYLGGKVVKLDDFQYILNENSTVGSSISFTSTSPVLNLNFKITAKERKYQDMVVLKSDMIKFEGYWSGTYIDPQTQNTIVVDNFPGLVQTADSIF